MKIKGGDRAYPTISRLMEWGPLTMSKEPPSPSKPTSANSHKGGEDKCARGANARRSNPEPYPTMINSS